MKTKILSWIVCAALLTMSFSLCVAAEEVLLPYVGDYRDMPMDLSLMEDMNTYARNVSQECGVNLVIALYDTVAGDMTSEAAAYLTDSNFEDNTLLLLVAEKSQSYTVHTVGIARTAVSETEKEEVFAAYNTAADYEAGIKAFVDTASAAMDTEEASPAVPSQGAPPATTAVGADNTVTTAQSPNATGVSRLYDEAGIFSDEDEAALAERLDAVSTERQMDVLIVTMAVTGEADLQTFGEQYFKDNGFGYHESADGVILLLYGDEWALVYQGNALQRLGADYEEAVAQQVSTYTLQADFLLAADMFIALTDSYLSGTVITTPSTVYKGDNNPSVPAGEQSFEGVGSVPSGRTGLIVGIVVAASAAVAFGVMLFLHLKKKRASTK